MYASTQPFQTLHQQAQMNSDQTYTNQQTVLTNDQYASIQNGCYTNDQVQLQQWHNKSVNRPHQIPGNQFVQQPPVQQLLHHQQYVTSNHAMQQCMPPLIGQQVTYQQQAPLFSQYIPSNNVIPPSTLMNQSVVTSSPGLVIMNNEMGQVTKRQIDDVSRSCDTSVNQQENWHEPARRQDSRYFTPKKMKTVTINGRNNNGNLEPTTSSDQNNSQRFEVSSAACRFAATRYPFSPFLISFKTVVKDKLVIDELVKHAKEMDAEAKIVAYRHKQVESDYSILVFVENIDSFCFLYNDANWPTHLCRETFVVKKPSTPPQLCIVLPNVALNTDWEEFEQSMKEHYQEVSDVIRLKNRSQHPVRAVKVSFTTAASRNAVLQQKEMSIDHMKYRVTEYLSPAQVLICGNCCGIGHFQKNCPHRDKTTCKVCGISCNDIKSHDCSGIPKCIRCGEDHKSTDSKCRVVKDYRAALTRNLLQQPDTQSSEFVNINPSQIDFPRAMAKYRQPFTASTTNQSTEASLDSLISKKLDSFLAEIKDESKKTRETIDDLREEMRKRDEETKEKIQVVEKKVQTLEVEFQDYMSMNNSIIMNICLVLANIDNLAGTDKKYFASTAQQLKTRSSSSKAAECV